LAPWNFRSLELSLPDPFTPWPIHSLALSLPGLLLPGTKVLWNFHSLNVSIAVYFRYRTLAFTPITQCEDQNNKIKKVQRNGRECINKIPNYEQNSTQCLSVKGRRQLPRPVFALFSDHTQLCGAMTLLRGGNYCNELISSGQCIWLR